MAAGAHGCISVVSNAAPRLCAELMNRWFAGDAAGALEIQDRLTPLHAGVFTEAGVTGAKYALSLLGRAREEVRLMLSGGHPDRLIAPPGMAIAHNLLKAFADWEG